MHELINSKSNRTYELFITNEQQPLHRTYVISTDNKYVQNMKTYNFVNGEVDCLLE